MAFGSLDRASILPCAAACALDSLDYVAYWHEIAPRRFSTYHYLDAAQVSLGGQRNNDAAGYDFVNGLLGLLERFAAGMLDAFVVDSSTSMMTRSPISLSRPSGT